MSSLLVTEKGVFVWDPYQSVISEIVLTVISYGSVEWLQFI